MSVIVKGKNPRKPHTVRFWVDGKQKERSFETAAEAKAFRTDTDHAARYDVTPVDRKKGRVLFGAECEAYIAVLPVADRSRDGYLCAYRANVKQAMGSRMLADVAGDRDAVETLLAVTMKGKSISVRRKVRQIITGTLDRAVKAGKIGAHKCDGIELADTGSENEEEAFDAALFPSFTQWEMIAESTGIVAWLMRGCGLRICEALAVEKSDFIMGGTKLRVSRQASRDGRKAMPLKKRKSTRDGRTVPVPAYVWDRVKDLPDGILTPGSGRAYRTYASVLGRFRTAAKHAGVNASVTPHWGRHQFASVLLGAGVPIGDVSEWLGHRDVNTTYRVYRSIMPDAPVRARSVLDADYKNERKAA